VCFHSTSSLRSWFPLTCSTPMVFTSRASYFNCSSTIPMRKVRVGGFGFGCFFGVLAWVSF
jgi:hypothetical protein